MEDTQQVEQGEEAAQPSPIEVLGTGFEQLAAGAEELARLTGEADARVAQVDRIAQQLQQAQERAGSGADAVRTGTGVGRRAVRHADLVGAGVPRDPRGLNRQPHRGRPPGGTAGSRRGGWRHSDAPH